MATSTYINSFWSRGSLDPQTYRTDAKPEEYRGFQIYGRIRGVVWDVVKDGVCIGQYAGRKGARGLVDAICDNPTDFWAVRAMDQLRARVQAAA